MIDRCWLYLMQRTGLVKDPGVRARDLTMQCGEMVEVVHAVEYGSREAARYAELRAHRRFAPHRTFGEWFTDVPQIRDHVAGLMPAEDESALATLARVTDLKRCPKCGHRGPIGADFGWREMGDGTIRSQSYCRRCR